MVPKLYQQFIRDITVVETKVRSGQLVEPTVFDSVEQMVEKAQEGFFVRDLVRNVVYCPLGEKLRFCALTKGIMKYRNVLACERCLVKCCDAKFKVVSFGLGQNVVGCRVLGSCRLSGF